MVTRLSSLLVLATAVLAVPGVVPGREGDATPAEPPPDLRLMRDEVTGEAISRLAGKHWGTVTLYEARFNGEIVERLRHAASIRTLRLSGTGLSGQVPRLERVSGLVGLEIGAPLIGRDLRALGALTNLEHLALPHEMTINVTGAREIAKLTRLKSLRLYNVDIDDASFVELQTLVNLEELDLSHTRITDAGLATLEKMPRLRGLELHRHPGWHTPQQLTDASQATIARLPELERLSLSGKITNAGLKQVAALPKLKALSIYSTEVTIDGLSALEGSTVENLTISSSQLGQLSECLQQFKKLRSLKHVHVIGGQFQDDTDWSQLLPEISWSFTS